MTDRDQLWLVTVALPDRYFTARLAVSAGSATDARALALMTLADLRTYVPAANLVITDVESAA